MALHSLYCADVPLRNCLLTHSLPQCRMSINYKLNFSVHMKCVKAKCTVCYNLMRPAQCTGGARSLVSVGR